MHQLFPLRGPPDMLKCNCTQSQQVQQHLKSNIWEDSYACILVERSMIYFRTDVHRIVLERVEIFNVKEVVDWLDAFAKKIWGTAMKSSLLFSPTL